MRYISSIFKQIKCSMIKFNISFIGNFIGNFHKMY